MRIMGSLCCLLLFVSVADTASAQRPGEAGIFFTPNPVGCFDGVHNGTIAFLPFDMYVVSFTLPLGMEAYEFGVTLPAGAIVSGGRTLPQGATDFGPGDDNWIVETGGICQGRVGSFVLVTYAGVVFLAQVGENVPVCMTGAVPTSFPDGKPGYLACQSPGELRTFEPAYDGCSCAKLNIPFFTPGHPCCNVAAEERSFSTLKSAYRQ